MMEINAHAGINFQWPKRAKPKIRQCHWHFAVRDLYCEQGDTVHRRHLAAPLDSVLWSENPGEL